MWKTLKVNLIIYLLETIQKINPTKSDDSTNLNKTSSPISAPERRKRTKTETQCNSREEGETNSKQKSDELWHVISELEEQLLKLSELVSGKTWTKTNNSDDESSKRELRITSSKTENMSKVKSKGNIEKITYYFLVIDKDENEKELNKINKALELKSTISKLQKENARLNDHLVHFLNDQVHFLKQENLDLIRS